VPVVSLELIDALGLPPTAGVVGAGAGASGLVDELLDRGFTDRTAAPRHRCAGDGHRARFDLVGTRREVHTTPAGATQPHTWVVLRRRGHSPAEKAKLDGT
jgi:hypothetical protein